MMNIFRNVPVYIKIYQDKIEITNLDTKQTITKPSLTKFSSNRLIVAEFNIALTLIRDIIVEFGLSRTSLKVLIQQMKEFEGGLCETEKRILRDLAEQVGGTSVYIVNRIQIMNDEEINGVLKLRNKDFKVR